MPTTIESTDIDQSRRLDALETMVGDSAQIPACYQGDDFRSPKELAIGQEVIHKMHCGVERVVKVVRRHKYSLTVEFEGRTYGVSLYELKRVPVL